MIDQIAYNYPSGTNKLTHIGDLVADNAFTYDIDNQSANNYTYDAIGNLTQDVKGGLSSIAWNPYGKITHISKGSNGNLYYDYDAMGNRIKKSFTQSNDNADKTWYVRDAQGNIMAIYSRKNYGTNQQVVLENYELYGSSRLGSLNLGIAVEGDYNLTPTTNYTRLLGLKQYEISNHLGNVLTTFSDQRVLAPAGMSTTNPTALTPKLISVQDYYPFGMIMDGRSWNTDKYSFGFNGKENDNEVMGDGNWQDYGMRMYNPRIGRFPNVDPLTKKYPFYTPYQFAGNKPIWAIDLDGLEEYIRTYQYDNGKVTLLKVERNIELRERMNTTPNGGQYGSGFYDRYNKATGEKFNENEIGTEQYVYLDSKGKPLNLKKDSKGNFVEGKGDIMKISNENLFGSIYIGPTNPTINDGGVDYRREPQDLADAAALQHDKDYDAVGAAGVKSALFDSKTLSADLQLVASCQNVVKMATEGKKDPYTGQAISQKTIKRAKLVAAAFSAIAFNKIKMIYGKK